VLEKSSLRLSGGADCRPRDAAAAGAAVQPRRGRVG